MTNRFDRVAAMALFLTEKTGSPNGYWRGRLTPTEQDELLDSSFGGEVIFDGATETVDIGGFEKKW